MALTTVPASLSATAITLTTAAQPNITSVGTLTGLTVSGNIAGTLTTAAQTNITSLGTLSALTISGDLTVDTNTLKVESSNNRVLVGKSSTGLGNAGVEFEGGQIKGTSANQIIQYLNRTGSNGDILELRKDNTIVSKIGARSSVVSYIVLDPRTSVKGAALIGGSIDANTGIINPGKNDGDITDGALNLGTASSRFKDAHFSGNITGTLTTAAQTNITSVGTLTSLTSGAHLINASSSAFGGSSVQGFNTDFLVDTGQGYSRHNSYHSGGSNHQFLVNETGSTTNAIALAITKDANSRFNGNVGVKVPSLLAFRANSNEGAIQIGKRGVIYADTGITTQIGNNTYITSANQRVAIENDHGSFYEQYQGKHYFYTTTQAETPGTLQTFTLQMMMLQNGNVGIGEPAPDRTFHAKSGANSNDGVIRIESANNNIMDMGTDGTGHFINCVNTDPFRVKFAGTEKFRIESSGDVDLINGGNLKFAAGYGVSFINNTDTATGETVSSSVLDDYEEGTFNGLMIPETGSITTGSSDNLCTYTRIGRLVTVQGRIQCSAASNPGGQLYVGNLPFSLYNAGENAFSSAVAVNLYNLASNMGGETVGEMTTTGGARILIRGNGGTTSSVHTAGNKIQANSIIGFTATYPTT